MNLSNYQSLAFKTSKIDWTTARGRQVAILGVLGEIGSLATVLKKHERDGIAYTGMRQDLAEECGDILWYLAAIASHYDLDLAKITEATPFQNPVAGENGHLWSLMNSVMLINSVLAADNEHFTVQPDDLQEPLGETVCMVLHAMNLENIDLADVLEENVQKTLGLFGSVHGAAPHRDDDAPIYEQLPRLATIQFLERPRGAVPEVLLRMNGLTIGDRLTDNSADPDGYRFHDALHLSYVAALGWSPVIRALLRLKRKYQSSKDEQQDGARATIVEEAITQQIFNYARDHNMLLGVTRIDPDLLKWVKKMVRGLEVEGSTPVEWQHAILEGYRVFRELKEHRGGYVKVDARVRAITYSIDGS